MEPETSAWYRRAAVELAETSALQVEWARGAADDHELIALIDTLPAAHRQPSLVFSAAAFAGAPAEGYAGWRGWVVENWPAVAAVARERRTQTNEPGRCRPLLAALARIPGPIALLEVGASAGLCLLPDRYSYRFDDGPRIGTGEPLLECRTSGNGEAPWALPRIVWRRGLDLLPLSTVDADDRRWLEALIPPDRPDRRARLAAALAAAAQEPPTVVAGDAVGALPAAASEAPHAATLVVVSLGTAVYLPREARGRLLLGIRELGARAVTFEAAGAIPEVAERLERLSAPEPSPFVLALDGEPLAYGSAHGDRLSWLTPAGLRDRPTTAA